MSLRVISVHLSAGLGSKAHSGAEIGGRVGNHPKILSAELFDRGKFNKAIVTLLPLVPSDPQDLGPTEGLVGVGAGPEGVPA